MNGQPGIEEMRQPDPIRFRDKPEKRAIAVKTPRSAHFYDFEGGSRSRYKSSTLGFPKGIFIGGVEAKSAA
jgi:hypothetical protein